MHTHTHFLEIIMELPLEFECCHSDPQKGIIAWKREFLCLSDENTSKHSSCS